MAIVATPRPMTGRQYMLYRWIFDFTCEHGYQPTYREMQAEFDWSGPNSPVCHLRRLVIKGWCELPAGESRSIRFLYSPDGRPFRGFEPK